MLQSPTVLTRAALKSEVVTNELAGASDAGNMKSAHIPLAVEPPARGVGGSSDKATSGGEDGLGLRAL